MEDAQIGWIAAIIIGGLAGWIASSVMKSDTGIFLNIVLGIIGAAIASFLFSFLGVSFGGWLGYLVAGIVGACILIWGARALRGSRTA
ncbi:putative membrane protein YeaQ/YmgE (transglycosylase-associated protein family) [Ancylobacter sp. 3268]|uniref:GlsB/YeaQ/YmgE family stress response membrane protein n=1 Tax=Ancylobacter sp. 3268 TaxID=2817752 RepID=UPI0028670B3F|nr:GlsB/YeaQ/YmgE family stress response membrane protein [Ancylobacter sp. 3268]MDR6952119.1 putative membrane protein YeaQ/YmgE (transglycosylase-associated protein family) [Ancylobacter sp. 3268]